MSLTPYWNGLVEKIWKAIGLPKCLGKSHGMLSIIQFRDLMLCFFGQWKIIYRRHIDNDITEAILEAI